MFIYIIAIYLLYQHEVRTTLIFISHMRKLRFRNITCSKSYCLQAKGSELESRPVSRGHAANKHRFQGGKSILQWDMVVKTSDGCPYFLTFCLHIRWLNVPYNYVSHICPFTFFQSLWKVIAKFVFWISENCISLSV